MNAPACPACLSQTPSVFVERPEDREYFVSRSAGARILRCGGCRSLYQAPWPDAAEAASFYKPNYQNYSGSSIPLLSRLYSWQQRKAGEGFVRRFGKDRSVLDFGCGQALFLVSLHEAGCRALAGFDFGARELPEAKSRGIELYSSLEALKASGRRFDIIRLNHVIEHLTDYDGTMRLLSELLAPGGVIIGQTPNAAHHTAGLMKSFWGPLHYPYHTLLFSGDGLRRASARWGMEVAAIEPTPMPTGWGMSFENIVKGLTRSRKEGRTALYSLYMALAAPLVILDYLLQSTAVFDFVLKRKTQTQP